MMAAQSLSLRGTLLHDEPLSRHTSWRVGGPADTYYQPADLDDLTVFLQSLPQSEPVYWLGLGSNLLVRDKGIRGAVIASSGTLKDLSVIGDTEVRAEVGVPSAKIAKFSSQRGLSGAEFLCGIPGTIGGALAMNAGAFGGETWDIVSSVETIDRTGKLRERTPEEFTIAYRSVKGLGEEWFVAVHFSLSKGDPVESKEKISALLAKRGDIQPTQMPNAGSVFKNPLNDYAARLIESCGLKDFCIGQACVSSMHANFIVNKGGASAEDIESLIYKVQATVLKQQGVRLEPEVRIVGEE